MGARISCGPPMSTGLVPTRFERLGPLAGWFDPYTAPPPVLMGPAMNMPGRDLRAAGPHAGSPPAGRASIATGPPISAAPRTQSAQRASLAMFRIRASVGVMRCRARGACVAGGVTGSVGVQPTA